MRVCILPGMPGPPSIITPATVCGLLLGGVLVLVW